MKRILLTLVCGLLPIGMSGVAQETAAALPLDYENGRYFLELSPDSVLEEADAGNAVAQNRAGFLYFHGKASGSKGSRENEEMALKCFRLSAERGVAQAQYNLGCCYQHGIGGLNIDLEKAQEWYSKSARQGCPEAVFMLAEWMFYGDNLPLDKERAVSFYRVLAENGFPDACRRLADCFGGGQGIASDRRLAVEWYLKAAEVYGCGWSAHDRPLSSAYVYPSCPCLAVDWRPESRESGNSSSLKAAECLRKAAELDSPEAQALLAKCYEQGYGVPVDALSAMQWEQKARNGFLRCLVRDCDAAEKGDAAAQYRLGRQYDLAGSLLKPSLPAAHYWYGKAAEQGHAEAQLAKARLYARGIGEFDSDMPSPSVERKQQHGQDALLWYRRAAEAQYHLGNCYAFGWDVEEDAQLAAYWYGKADEQDFLFSMMKLYVFDEMFWDDYYPQRRAVARSSKGPSEVLVRYQKALAGDAEEQLSMGRHFERQADLRAALAWYRKAAARGNPEADKGVERVEEEMRQPVPYNRY